MIPDVKNRKHRTLKPKTMKMTAAGAAPPKKKVRITSGTEVEVIESEDSLGTGRSTGDAAGRGTISPASSFQVSYPVPAKVCDIL